MTETEFERRRYFGQIQPPITMLHFRFHGSDYWWTEFFDSRPYSTKPEDFKNALKPFCEFKD